MNNSFASISIQLNFHEQIVLLTDFSLAWSFAQLQFSAQIDRLANFHATAHPPPSASATHALERHRDVLVEYKRDYARTKVGERFPVAA